MLCFGSEQSAQVTKQVRGLRQAIEARLQCSILAIYAVLIFMQSDLKPPKLGERRDSGRSGALQGKPNPGFLRCDVTFYFTR